MLGLGNVLDLPDLWSHYLKTNIEWRSYYINSSKSYKIFFMSISEASQLVIQALKCYGEVFLLDMGDPVFIKDLAHQMVCLQTYY